MKEQFDNIEILADLMVGNNYTLSLAESLTGGLIGAKCSELEGSSKWFKGGVIAYNNETKKDILGVRGDILLNDSEYSAETVLAMVKSVVYKFGTTCGVAVSGVAGPNNDRNFESGTVFFGIYVNNNVHIYCKIFDGNRDEVRQQTVKFAIDSLIHHIKTV